jgi:hypothetical protein
VLLSGQEVSGNIYVYLSPDTGVARVSFYVDDPEMSGSPEQVERYRPYDLGGTNRSGSAAAYDTSQLASGSHTLTALIALSGGGSEVLQSTFTVGNGTGSVIVSWVAPTMRADGTPFLLSELTGYRIYQGTAADQLKLLVDLKDPTATSYTVSGLSAGTHYFAVTTCDVSGSESTKSNIVGTTIP